MKAGQWSVNDTKHINWRGQSQSEPTLNIQLLLVCSIRTFRTYSKQELYIEGWLTLTSTKPCIYCEKDVACTKGRLAFHNFSTANNSESSNTKWTLMQDRFHGQSNKNLGIFFSGLTTHGCWPTFTVISSNVIAFGLENIKSVHYFSLNNHQRHTEVSLDIAERAVISQSVSRLVQRQLVSLPWPDLLVFRQREENIHMYCSDWNLTCAKYWKASSY